MLLRYSA
jgi:hypothetical protein